MWRALIVDDSATCRETIEAALEPFGMEVGHAADGHAAVTAATNEPWDLIFLDIVMPLLDGPAALAAIRGMGITTPVVLISSTANASAITPAVRLGGVSYLAKPFTPEQVRTYAAKALKQDTAVLGYAPDDSPVPLALDEELRQGAFLDHRDADLRTLGVHHQLVLHDLCNSLRPFRSLAT